LVLAYQAVEDSEPSTGDYSGYGYGSKTVGPCSHKPVFPINLVTFSKLTKEDDDE
jgi:hypothetical protein